MNLAAYRQYNESDVINGLFALSSPFTGTKGFFVAITGVDAVATGVNPLNNDGWGPSIVPGQPNTYSSRYQINARVTYAASGTKPLGLQLWDVLEVNPFNEPLLYRPEELAERQAVLSGQALPILTRGIVNIIGAQGNVSGNAFGVVRTGILVGVSTAPSVPSGGGTPSEYVVGTFLGTTGRDGAALFKVDL